MVNKDVHKSNKPRSVPG